MKTLTSPLLNRRARKFLASLTLLTATGAMLTPLARAQYGSEQVVRNFALTQGSAPQSPLVLANDGTFFGTTGKGGTDNYGTVYGVNLIGTVTVLHNFTSDEAGANGVGQLGLTLGADGNLYGTTTQGGTTGAGTVYRVTPAGEFSTVVDFGQGETVGSQPTNILQATDGNFYGSFSGQQVGNLYKLTPDGQVSLFYRGVPTSTGIDYLMQASDGNLYGTSTAGGDNGAGAIVRVGLDGTATTLYSFTAANGFGVNDDGSTPNCKLIEGKDGALYGSTLIGGQNGSGTLFKITTDGTFTNVHNFSVIDGKTNDPVLLGQDSDGLFVGIKLAGGTFGLGGVFQLTPAGTVTLLNSFSPTGGGIPQNNFVQSTDGNFYSVTQGNDTYKNGNFIREVITAHPPFFTGEASLGSGVYYLGLPNGNPFGYYSYLDDSNYVYHFDLGYEYVFNADDDNAGVYLYDFKSNGFFYTSPGFSFPYLYDFSQNSVVYYFPNPNSPGHYNINGQRVFYVFSTGQYITK